MKIHFFSKSNCYRCDLFKAKLEDAGLWPRVQVWRLEEEDNSVIDWMIDKNVDTFPTLFLEQDNRLLVWRPNPESPWFDRFVATDEHWSFLQQCITGSMETASTQESLSFDF